MLENSRLLAKEEREALIESQRDSSPGGRNGSYRGGSGIAGLEFKQNLPVLRTPIPILTGTTCMFKA